MEKLGPFDPEKFQQQVSEFTQSLDRFLIQCPLVRTLMTGPIDHIAVKAYDLLDLRLYLKSWPNFCSEEPTAKPMDNRHIATALLKEPIIFPEYGETLVLEVIEPKPGKTELPAKFDHIEIRNSDFPAIHKLLNELGISYTDYQNPKHQAIVVPINQLGQEIKFTDGNLAKIAQEEFDSGEAILISSLS